MEKFMEKFTKDFFFATIIRAIWTMAQAMLSMITIGMAITDVNWTQAISISIVAGVYSILKSIVVGLPEIAPDVKFDESEEKQNGVKEK